MRIGKRKLIRLAAPEGPFWMEFDLATDPAERTNLAGADGSGPSSAMAWFTTVEGTSGKFASKARYSGFEWRW